MYRNVGWRRLPWMKHTQLWKRRQPRRTRYNNALLLNLHLNINNFIVAHCQEYMCKLEELNNLLVERTQLSESLQMGHPSQSQDAQQRAAASRAESAPSLVLPGNTSASAAVAAIDETTFSFSSADSDLAGNTHEHPHPHDSHSHHHSAAAAPSDRSSSWAIVTSNGSRASSTLPSTASMDELSRGTAHSPTHHATPYAAQNAPHHNPSAVASDGADDRSDFRAALSSDSLLFISQVCVFSGEFSLLWSDVRFNYTSLLSVQLQSQLEAVRKDLARRGIDLEAAHQQLQYEKDEKVPSCASYHLSRSCIVMQSVRSIFLPISAC